MIKDSEQIKQTKRNKAQIIYNFSLVTIIIFGLFLRTFVYLSNHSMWLDECSLAMSVLNNKFIGALEYNQAAPSGFLILSKIIVVIFGDGELAFRFLPFLSSILSVILFYFLAKRFLVKKSSVIIANALFCFNYYLIYYAQEYKQYSFDVFIAIALILGYLKFKDKITSAKKAFLLGLGLSVINWFSIPSIFISTGIIIDSMSKNKKTCLQNILLVTPVAINLILYYTLHASKVLGYQIEFNFWQDGFINYNFSNIIKIFVENINYYFSPCKFSLFALILIIAAFIKLRKFPLTEKMILTTPIITLGIASYLHLYPIQQRVTLFVLPIIIILILIPIDKIENYKKIGSISFIILTFIYFSPYFSQKYFKSIGDSEFYKKTDLRGIVKLLSEKSTPENYLILSSSSKSPYEFYSRKYPVKYYKKIESNMPKYDEKLYMEALNKLAKGHYIFLIAHDVARQPVIPFINKWCQLQNIKPVYLNKGESVIVEFDK